MIGEILGHYQVTEEIGIGGIGKVYRCIDRMLQRDVAIKVLKPELARHAEVVARFQSEAVLQARLDHPNIAKVYAFHPHGDSFFMVMEYVKGESLENIISQLNADSPEPENPKGIPVEQATFIFKQVLSGIAYAHKHGIIHRDLKPGNIMLTFDGVAKVMDFGIAKVLGSTRRMTNAGRMVGTIEYMSPEQIKGSAELDQRSDIYSLGILFYEMLTGKVPYTSDSEYDLMRQHLEESPLPVREIIGELPPQIEAAINRALAKQPEDRFQRAEEFLAAIADVKINAYESDKEWARQLIRPKPILKATRLGVNNPDPSSPIAGFPEVVTVAPASKLPLQAQGQSAIRSSQNNRESFIKNLGTRQWVIAGVIGVAFVLTMITIVGLTLRGPSSNAPVQSQETTKETAPVAPPAPVVIATPSLSNSIDNAIKPSGDVLRTETETGNDGDKGQTTPIQVPESAKKKTNNRGGNLGKPANKGTGSAGDKGDKKLKQDLEEILKR